MPTHTYSEVLYDVDWQAIGEMLSASGDMASMNCRVTYDTSGGTLSDGTTFETEARITAEYEYTLKDEPLQKFAKQLTGIPRLPDDQTELEKDVRDRAGAGPPPKSNAPPDAGPPAKKGNGNGKK
jgi:hypothetical protein